MSDFIDRMNAYYEIVDYFHEKGYLFEEVNGILENDIEDIIMEAPTVDAIPVVHCKDCKHYIRWCGKNICNCRYYFDGTGIELREEDYCSRGVKRDE